MGIYTQFKSAVTAREIAEHYGYKVNRNGMMKCPFHDDRTPSMKIDQNFICFGCQEKGDAVHFASLLLGQPPYAAVQKVIGDMRLDVMNESGEKETKTNFGSDACRKVQDIPLFDRVVNHLYDVFCRYLRLLNRWAVEYAPTSPSEDHHPLFIEAMQKRDYIGYLLDLLFYGSEEDKTSVIIDKGKKVQDLEKRINEYESEYRESFS